jgi:hypothetical protein
MRELDVLYMSAVYITTMRCMHLHDGRKIKMQKQSHSSPDKMYSILFRISSGKQDYKA